MNPWKREFRLRESAIWMQGKWASREPGKDIWWTPRVLTNANKDGNPEYWPADAGEIFAEMKARGMLKEVTITATNEKGESGPATLILLEPSKAWIDATSGNRYWHLGLMPLFRGLARGAKSAWLLAVIAYFAANFGAKYLENLADHLFEKSFPKPPSDHGGKPSHHRK